METFIHQQYLQDISVCDQLIEVHRNSTQKGPGLLSKSVSPHIKDSIDLSVKHIQPDILNNYFSQLQHIIKSYVEKFKASNFNVPWGVLQGQIQYYSPGGGFKTFHCERTGNVNSWRRHLVFMTYLNEVTDHGGTEFLYQQITIQPRKGLTLIWPVDWTHTHRGIVSPSQEKYIITGWYGFV